MALNRGTFPIPLLSCSLIPAMYGDFRKSKAGDEGARNKRKGENFRDRTAQEPNTPVY